MSQWFKSTRRHHFATVFFISFFLLPTSNSSAESDDIYFSANKTDKKYDHILVERITSADTIVLEGGEKVKLIGLKAPEPPRRARQEQDENGFIIEPENLIASIEEQAFDFAKFLLEGKFVRLEFDAQKRTDTFQTLAYVYLEDNTFVNSEIIRQGFASLQIAAPNLKYAELLRAAYREARTEKKGLHNE